MSPHDDERVVDPYELVERHWPYDGPYSDELTTGAALMIGRLGRYLNNATGKRDGMPHAAAAGRVLAELHAAVAGYEQLLRQLAGFLDREAINNPTLYDDRRDRPGAVTAQAAAVRVRACAPSMQAVADVLQEAAGLASHVGSD